MDGDYPIVRGMCYLGVCVRSCVNEWGIVCSKWDGGGPM